MIKILYSCFDRQFSSDHYNLLLDSLPQVLKEKVLKFYRWEDQHTSLIGKLLLKEGLEMFNIQNSGLDLLEYTSYNKPYLNNGLSFNISHSEKLVTCILSDNIKVGIDAEKIAEIDINDFRNQWSSDEWKNIKYSKNQSHQFFRYWTRKEAIIKANGKGLSLPLKDINVISNIVEVEAETWYLLELGMLSDYIVHVATSKELNIDDVDILNYDFGGDSKTTLFNKL